MMSGKIKPGNDYTYPCDPAPPPGGSREIAPGVHWIRLPVPYEHMDHVNVWLLEDGDDWTLVDTGPSHQSTVTAWERLFDTLLLGRPIKRIICTHHHPDHVGLAEWIRKRYGSQIWMTATEYEMLAGDLSSTNPQHEEKVSCFYRMHGLDNIPGRELPKNLSRISAFALSHTLKDREHITIGNLHWKTIITGGHTPEHFALYCMDNRILIGGDLLLPTISSNVGVYPRLPDSDPLSVLFESIDRLLKLPDDILVLPSHETPYAGLWIKLQRLKDRYNRRFNKIKQACVTPQCAFDLLPTVFRSNLTGINLLLAMLEMVAYLNYLHHRKTIELNKGLDGVCRFQICT